MDSMIASRVLRALIRSSTGLMGVIAGLIDCGSIHAGGEVVADFLAGRGCGF